jgi:uncharacterized membrane protein YheB (UPF0754 family)
MDPHAWGELFFAVAVGTLAGGMTDTVSIYLLFRPYEPKGIGPFRIQGALPKNKSRLARSIAKTVGERLLTAEDLAARLDTPAVRATFDDAIGRMVDEVVGRERGPLRAYLSPEFAAALDEALAGFAPRVAERVSDWFRTPEAVARVADVIHKLRVDVRDRPLAEVLTPERRDALRVRINELVDQFVDGPELERTLRRFLETQAEQLATDERPLLSRLPPGVVGAVEQAIADYIPVALERLGWLLADPDVRRRVEHALRSAFDGSVRELLLHERLLARLVVTDRTIERLVDGFEHEGFDRFADAVASPAMREDLALAVRDAVVSFLRVPAAERLRTLGGTRTTGAVGSLGDWLVTIARDDTTRRVLAGAADRAVESLERWTWGDVLDALPADRVAELVAGGLSGTQGRRWAEGLVHALAERLLSQPMGRPAEWLGENTTAQLRSAVTQAAWAWVQTQIPRIVQQIQVEQIIEQKVNDLPIERVERLIRDVSQRELDLIIRVGYVLGGLFGFGAYWLGRAFGL